MVSYNNNQVTITCDKCGRQSTAGEGAHNIVFANEGWCLVSSARKYHNKCRKCQTPKERKAMDFALKNFPTVK